MGEIIDFRPKQDALSKLRAALGSYAADKNEDTFGTVVSTLFSLMAENISVPCAAEEGDGGYSLVVAPDENGRGYMILDTERAYECATYAEVPMCQVAELLITTEELYGLAINPGTQKAFLLPSSVFETAMNAAAAFVRFSSGMEEDSEEDLPIDFSEEDGMDADLDVLDLDDETDADITYEMKASVPMGDEQFRQVCGILESLEEIEPSDDEESPLEEVFRIALEETPANITGIEITPVDDGYYLEVETLRDGAFPMLLCGWLDGEETKSLLAEICLEGRDAEEIEFLESFDDYENE